MENDLIATAKDIRKRIIKMSYKAEAHHIGSCLSCVEILTALYFKVMQPGDRFILSAGHKAFALYAILSCNGVLVSRGYSISELCHHPERNLGLGIDATTGSLGHGLSIGCGMAMAAPDKQIYVLMSDGELNEGSVWEAIMFAGHHQLNNLTMIIDYNKMQALGKCCDILDMSPLKPKLEAFHWRGSRVHGHWIPDLLKAFGKDGNWPHFIIADTIKGKGISFMENELDWHYNTLDEETYDKALKELG